ncbi:MAG: Mth938-like domain-containing protein [Rhodospirillales bacterium]|nr:Mth938-like domain-containing protein [Rhodospirillales bacterium]
MAHPDTPSPGGRQRIQAYGGGGFRVSGQRIEGSVLVFADHADAWPARSIDDIAVAEIDRLVADAAAGTLVVIGCGAHFEPMPRPLREALAAAGINAEWMATGAACRTFNLLAGEARAVCAALLAVE